MTYKIITIDGPSGVGKGTVATMIADELGLNYLDSGSLYRALALKLFEKNHNSGCINKCIVFFLLFFRILFKGSSFQKAPESEIYLIFLSKINSLL